MITWEGQLMKRGLFCMIDDMEPLKSFKGCNNMTEIVL